ncbi:diguanylate cyclase domain-containing protein [Ectobacillus polymachus]|uniref:sensor domain-containing protein n=1 Tax=Ectobacillus polymachus TaxID=1508806 RepID=UPI003A8C1A38
MKQEPVEREHKAEELLEWRRDEVENREKEFVQPVHNNETLYTNILDALPINIFLEDRQGRRVYANKQAYESNHEEIAEQIRESDNQSYAFTGKKMIKELSSNEEYLLRFSIDLTDRVKAEQQLCESEQTFRMFFDQAADSFFLIDCERKLVDVNTTVCELLGYTREELLSLTLEDVSSLSSEQIVQCYQLCNVNRSINMEHLLICKDQSHFPVDTNICLFQIGNKQMYTASCRDIRDKKKSEERIRYMAYHDELTGLPNRWKVRSYIEQYMADERNHEDMFAILLLDIDDFKVINDTLGHQAGDLLLQRVTKRIRQEIREQDMFARLGGDEFTIFLPNLVTTDYVTTVCENLIRLFKEPFMIQGNPYQITTSIGVSFSQTVQCDLDILVKHADMAMYCAKEQGGNQYRFFEKNMLISTKK